MAAEPATDGPVLVAWEEEEMLALLTIGASAVGLEEEPKKHVEQA
jgi:hypothetical protein